MARSLGPPLVVATNVEKRFGSLVVLRDVSFTVARGETVCVIGPSGSGKSTLLRCINALVAIDKGSIKVEGVEVNDPDLDKLALFAETAGGGAALSKRRGEDLARAKVAAAQNLRLEAAE